MLICTKGVWAREGKLPKIVKFGCFCMRARSHGRRVFGVRLENRHDEGFLVKRFRGAISGAVEAVWDARRQLFLGKLEAVLGHAEAIHAPPLHEKCMCLFAPFF